MMPTNFVDYTLNLLPDNRTHGRIRQHLRHQQLHLQTVNQTSYGPVRFRPAIISIETKTADNCDGKKALVQLGTWAAAHFFRLRGLQNPNAATDDKFPVHPLILVIGHRWKLLASYYVPQKLEDERTGTPSVEIVDCHMEIGNTETLLNCYKLVEGLRALTEEWTWWEQRTRYPEFDPTVNSVNDMGHESLRGIIVGISMDGERKMTGRISGVATRFQNVAKAGPIRIWCGAHQLDIVLQSAYTKLGNEALSTNEKNGVPGTRPV